jgi:hypothetical protein
MALTVCAGYDTGYDIHCGILPPWRVTAAALAAANLSTFPSRPRWWRSAYPLQRVGKAIGFLSAHLGFFTLVVDHKREPGNERRPEERTMTGSGADDLSSQEHPGTRPRWTVPKCPGWDSNPHGPDRTQGV